jgi:hypothetical protein
MTDNVKGCLIVQFTHRGKDVTATASYKGYAAAWLKHLGALGIQWGVR